MQKHGIKYQLASRNSIRYYNLARKLTSNK
jgi:hypothetical protein